MVKKPIYEHELAQKLIDLSQITGIQPYSQNRQSPVKIRKFTKYGLKLEYL